MIVSLWYKNIILTIIFSWSKCYWNKTQANSILTKSFVFHHKQICVEKIGWDRTKKTNYYNLLSNSVCVLYTQEKHQRKFSSYQLHLIQNINLRSIKWISNVFLQRGLALGRIFENQSYQLFKCYLYLWIM